MEPRVYIVIVNYKGSEDTIECLESVLKSDYANFGVIVVDNSEEPGFFLQLRAWAEGTTSKVNTRFAHLVFPLIPKPSDALFVEEAELLDNKTHLRKLVVVKAKSNRGFAAANNVALRYIQQRNDHSFVWILNNDTVIERDSLTRLVQCAQSGDLHIGIWGSKLLLYHQPEILQAVGGRYNTWLGKVNEIGFNEKDTGFWDQHHFQMDYVIGAAMLVRKEFLEDVGLMDEDFFLYYEELDWAIRGKRKGWKMGFCAESKVYHKMGASINKEKVPGNSLLADFYSVRNRILITKKYFPLALITLYPAFLKFIINRIRLRQFSRIPMMFKIMLTPKKHLIKG